MSIESKRESGFAKRIVKYFLQGLFYVVPIAATVFVIFYLIVQMDGILQLDIPGLGLLIILSGVTLIGYLGTFFLGYLKPFDRAIENTPLIKLIYSSMKDLMNAFVGKKNQFKKPVLVRVGEDLQLERLGFITQDKLSDLGISEEKIAVYIPFSYAISGQVFIVPKKNVSPISASSADVMKFIISGGVTQIETKKENNEN